ncbi:hypothetical protein CBM2623_A320122 [Cupriavidus taiwanensis]|nr:hypothetical protein CBM2588_A240126 [Cupriavidus taiwanensis]SOY85840.1 hypothetical protein CBM2591_A320157 [Cupriavidus taiwanensis]SPA29421.1 hypothetical protein CBM2623_A320122 [Cupriavidus taiwanensis]
MYDCFLHAKRHQVGAARIGTHSLRWHFFQPVNKYGTPISGARLEIEKGIRIDGIATCVQCFNDEVSGPDSHMAHPSEADHIQVSPHNISSTDRIRADLHRHRRRAPPLRVRGHI